MEPLQQPPEPDAGTGDDGFAPGSRVEVRSRLDGRWAKGFEVIDASDQGYRLRRLSDHTELPISFAPTEVRRERRKGTWWY